jgi:hypothetical protein
MTTLTKGTGLSAEELAFQHMHVHAYAYWHAANLLSLSRPREPREHGEHLDHLPEVRDATWADA